MASITRRDAVPDLLADAIRLMKQQAYLDARDVLERLLKTNPNNPEAIYYLATCEYELKHFDLAKMGFTKFIADHPDNPRGYYAPGQVQERLGNREAAIKTFKTALTVDRRFELASRKLAVLGALPTRDLKKEGAMTISGAGSPQTRVAPSSPASIDKKYPGQLLLRCRRKTRSFSFLWLLFVICGSTLPLATVGALVAGRGKNNDPFLYAFFMSLYIGIPVGIILLWKSVSTMYEIYEKRIDIAHGVLHRTRRYMWLFEIEDLIYSQNPANLLTSDAKITIRVQTPDGPPRIVSITGLGSAHFMRDMFQELKTAALVERRLMKQWWV
jgi:tetratricopeptide (TPR) repeat protein